MSPEDALEEVKRSFIFDNYIVGDMGQWLSVGKTVQKYRSVGDKVFDLGSGPCDKTAIAQVMGCQCTAVDDLADEWHLRGDNINKIEQYAAKMGIKFSKTFTPPETGTFDMVMMNDVLEHIHDSPRDLLNLLVDGLKEGGHLFVTVPNLANIRKRLDLMRGKSNLAQYDMYYWYRGPWRGPKREYVRDDLESMCENLGLNIVELEAVHHMLQRLPGFAKLPYKLVTSLFPDWRDSWLLVAQKPVGWTPRTTISDDEFAKIYGRSSSEFLYRDDAE